MEMSQYYWPYKTLSFQLNQKYVRGLGFLMNTCHYMSLSRKQLSLFHCLQRIVSDTYISWTSTRFQFKPGTNRQRTNVFGISWMSCFLQGHIQVPHCFLQGSLLLQVNKIITGRFAVSSGDKFLCNESHHRSVNSKNILKMKKISTIPVNKFTQQIVNRIK